MKYLFVVLIKGYQYLISPLLGSNCRFHPTCSAYGIEAIEKYGAGKGFWLAIKRMGKCHPWHKGEYKDPVP